ncbi:response regulator [Mucilaginibacter sp. UR6-1]|uniref:response regulator n=1 Tax=Mucilaginibacter sp. UR6-1 TaxID=1435643 RepID=UPI001E3DE23B|nr:response regulator [Mucilaginibacter sp. UR6-1]MCC8411277.1 response regulator [Mucilaginibacter sp. UR6-1]
MTEKKILLIEDNTDITEIISTVLADDGYKVSAITEADDIVQTVLDTGPDLIITDYILEGINGGEYCSAIKRDARTAHLPVIILSGYGKVLESLGDYGADQIMDKPFNNDDLSATVAQLLASSKKEDQMNDR